MEKINSCSLGHSLCVSLVWQHEQTNKVCLAVNFVNLFKRVSF